MVMKRGEPHRVLFPPYVSTSEKINIESVVSTKTIA